MNWDTLAAEVARLQQDVEQHGERLAALEKRLDPKERQRRMAAELDLLLDELAGEAKA